MVRMTGALAAVAVMTVASASLTGSSTRLVLKVGLFLPARGEDGAEAQAIARGARLGADAVNAASGPVHVELVARPADGQWTAGAREFVALAYDDDAVVILAGPGGRRTHVAEQIVTRAAGRLLLFSFASDPTVTEVRVPWVFRMLPDDRAQALALVAALQRSPGSVRVGLLTEAGDYDAESLATELTAVAGNRVVRVPFEDTAAARNAATARVRAMSTSVVVLAGRPGPAGRLAAVLHAGERGMRIIGPSRLAAREFILAAGPASEQVELLSPSVGAETATPDASARFMRDYWRAYDEAPPPLAVVAFDAIAVAAAAAERAGTEPRALVAKLRHGITDGLSGPVRFDASGNRLGQPQWLAVRTGRFVVRPAPS